jgi:hypothetical protein
MTVLVTHRLNTGDLRAVSTQGEHLASNQLSGLDLRVPPPVRGDAVGKAY